MTAIPGPSGPTPPGGEQELAVDLAAFLPEGVSLGAGTHGDAASEALGTSAAVPAIDVSALEQIERDLDAVDAALVAIDAGTYGTCRSCGGVVDDARLAVDPTARTCAAHR